MHRNNGTSRRADTRGRGSRTQRRGRWEQSRNEPPRFAQEQPPGPNDSHKDTTRSRADTHRLTTGRGDAIASGNRQLLPNDTLLLCMTTPGTLTDWSTALPKSTTSPRDAQVEDKRPKGDDLSVATSTIKAEDLPAGISVTGHVKVASMRPHTPPRTPTSRRGATGRTQDLRNTRAPTRNPDAR